MTGRQHGLSAVTARLMAQAAPSDPAAERRRRSLTVMTTPHVRRERALLLRDQYPDLIYDFVPSPGNVTVNPLEYDTIIVAFSAGKDSLALVLLLLLMGVPKEKLELWHHDVDGAEGSTLMDWPCTRDYCRKVASALDLKLYLSWKVGGYEQEMTRHEAPTAGYRFELPGGGFQEAGGESKNRSTREKFPQVAADLSVRWCSAYLKIMVADVALRHQDRFNGRRTLFLTGERAEESASRARYEIFERHRTDRREGRLGRHVDTWRPVLHWPEPMVWKIIERFQINPHPAYHLGWGRVSCAPCIFGSADQWASLRIVNPGQFNAVAAYERKFRTTIDRKYDVSELAIRGNPFPGIHPRWIRAATSREYTEPVFVAPWILPSGAILGDGSGPT